MGQRGRALAIPVGRDVVVEVGAGAAGAWITFGGSVGEGDERLGLDGGIDSNERADELADRGSITSDKKGADVDPSSDFTTSNFVPRIYDG